MASEFRLVEVPTPRGEPTGMEQTNDADDYNKNDATVYTFKFPYSAGHGILEFVFQTKLIVRNSLETLPENVFPDNFSLDCFYKKVH